MRLTGCFSIYAAYIPLSVFLLSLLPWQATTINAFGAKSAGEGNARHVMIYPRKELATAS